MKTILLHVDPVTYHHKPTMKNEIGKIKIRMANPSNIQEMTVEEIAQALQEGRTIQPGVCPLSETSIRNGAKGTKKDDFTSQQIFLTDIDNENPNAPQETPEHLEVVLKENGLKAAFMYESFHSTSKQIRFRYAIVCDEVITDREERDSIQRALISLSPQADQSTSNADRIYFGTNKGIIKSDYNAVCKKKDLVAVANTLTVSEPSEKNESKNSFSVPRFEDDEIIKKAKIFEPKFRNLYKGNWEIYDYSSQSEADFALLVILAYWTDRNPEQMERIFSTSGLVRDKWNDREDYRKRSILRACECCEQSYTEEEQDEQYNNSLREQHWLLKQLNEKNFAKNKNYGAKLDAISCARFLSDVYKQQYRYCIEAKEFYHYDRDKGIWKKDDKKTINVKCMDFARVLPRYILSKIREIKITEADKITDQEIKNILKFARSYSKRDTRRKLIQDIADLTAFSKLELDSNPNYLNCLDGVLDLATGKVLPHNPNFLMSKCTRAEIHGERDGTRWERFLQEIQQGDTEMIQYIQQVLGSGMAYGNPNEEFYIFYGSSTRNGKSTLIETVSYVLGDYAVASDPMTFGEQSKFSSDSSKPTPDLARLYKARFVSVPEPDKKLTLDVAKIKKFTGQNKIIARNLNEGFFEFTADFKLYFDVNCYPRVNDRTLFSSNRVVVIPFEKHFEKDEIDTTLKTQFRRPKAVNYILSWLYEGLKRSKGAGYKQRPKKIEKYVCEFEFHEDRFGQFMEECLIADTENPDWQKHNREGKNHSSKIPLKKLYILYRGWCESGGINPQGKEKINDQLKERQIYQYSGKIDGHTYTNLCKGYQIRMSKLKEYTSLYFGEDNTRSYIYEDLRNQD